MRVGTPIRILDATSRKATKVIPVPHTETMDEGYSDILRSECYILGNFDVAGERYELKVPRTAMIDDVVVALEGSCCFHLLRRLSSPELPQCYSLVGAIAHSRRDNISRQRGDGELEFIRESQNPTETFLIR